MCVSAEQQQQQQQQNLPLAEDIPGIKAESNGLTDGVQASSSLPCLSQQMAGLPDPPEPPPPGIPASLTMSALPSLNIPNMPVKSGPPLLIRPADAGAGALHICGFSHLPSASGLAMPRYGPDRQWSAKRPHYPPRDSAAVSHG
mmetsp:Transcript_14436/g.36674  ORF Transcript_14436/g.36674 Transcript_14436/m.36674 type:complete len:144 (-) Transcript_14436:170-601(-)